MRKKLLLIGLLGCAIGCQSTGQVKTDFDPAANFDAFKTYATTAPEIMNEKDLLNNSLLRTRIEGLINENMSLKGFKMVAESENPSLLVRYWVGVKDKQDTQYVGSPMTGSRGSYGPYWDGRWGPMYDQYVTYDYREGTLIVDLIDPVSKNLIWRAYLQQVLADKDTNFKRAQANLQKAFKDYPPKVETPKSAPQVP